MNKMLPKASRKRLEELLKYLGPRAEDFKKCFDTHSSWCLVYADLIMRGLVLRELSYGERHHIIPVAFYRKFHGYKGNRWAKKVTDMNLSVLSFGEHLYAHLLAYRCANPEYRGVCAAGFWKMYTCNSRTKRSIPSDEEFFNCIDEKEAMRIRSMVPRIAAVDARGGTHMWEDFDKYQKEQRELFKQNNPNYYKEYYAANSDKKREYSREYVRGHKDEKREYDKEYRAKNEDRIRKSKKEYSVSHRKQMNEHNRIYNSTPERKQKKHEIYLKRKSRDIELMRKRRAVKYEQGFRIRHGKWVFLGPDAPPTRKPVRPVNQYDVDGNLIASYVSMNEASQATGLQSSLIGHVCRGKRKTTGGFVFRYADEQIQPETKENAA